MCRAMEFLVELFHNLLQHPDWTMSQVCTDSYGKTLKQWHGWLASSSFSLAMKLAPDRKKFMDVISGTGDVNADMEAFCTSFSPFLEENHKFLVRCPVLWDRKYMAMQVALGKGLSGVEPGRKASKGLDNLKAS
ncbi:Glycolipid transfer protein 1 [Vitis vinifera]|uniref:Glycolipid transfer protein 1 n=1 Tax=Vitis vinifera TaxID=29760 RepID=A0A438GHY2_VITVI|nr:Glycolipid transfer protein 1 [Vitis vinifera]